jgi:acetyl esterase/lipase
MKQLIALIALVQLLGLNAQDTIMPLWPAGKIPNYIASEEKETVRKEGITLISKVQEPTIAVYLPSQRNAVGKAMLIFPGGGYGVLAYDWEGADIAKFLNAKGIAGIVVKYRLPSDVSQKDKHLVPLMDAQRALRLVRHHAADFHIDPNGIGIIGFSAGGHLAATLGTHFADVVHTPLDAMDTISARPDFMALGYPVITFREGTHSGSKANLLGKEPKEEWLAYFSNEKQVTEATPPTFLFHATDDAGVPVENSLLFYTALKDKGVSATLLIYPKGGHGFSLAREDPFLRTWPERMFEWMESLE